MNWLTDINELKLPPLSSRSHISPDEGLCAMEMVAFLERLPHSDAPECTCPVIAAYVRGINDMMTDDERQRLLPYLPRLVGTVAPEHEHARAEYLAWQAVRVFAPMALRSSGMDKYANILERQTDLRAARDAARAAGYAATADAARAAGYAARAAGYAATAEATAATATAYATSAAAYAAAYAARSVVVDAALRALDGVLEIGAAQPRAWPRDRVAELAELAR